MPHAALSEEDEEPAFAITPYFGYRIGGEFENSTDGSTRELDESQSFGVILNMLQIPGRYYELSYSKQDTRLQGTLPFDLSLEYYHFGGSIDFDELGHKVIPYFVFTAGATRFSPEPAAIAAETKLSFAIGGGVRFPFNKHLSAQLETRAYVTLLDADSAIFCFSTGATAGCNIRVKGSAFIQVQAFGGLRFAF
jgi:hypothetical protein